MKSSSLFPIHRLRVFSACLLSLLMLMAPMAPLFASVNRIAAEHAEQKAAHKVAQSAQKQLSPQAALERASLINPPPPVAPNLSATLSDSFVDTSPADGRADAGSTVTYTAVISNAAGATDATNVSFTDTPDPNSTLVGGSVKVSPLAFADSYNGTENTVLNVSAPGVLTNDTGTPAPTAMPIAGGATTAGGTVTLNADGSFAYTPKNNFSGTDTFTYTATNGQLPNDTATVTITVACGVTVTNPATTTGTVDAAFSQTFTQTGGAGTTNFTLNSGTLPAGLTLHTSGVLDGTPTQAGSFPITVKATDSNGCTGVGPTYTLVIACQTITVTNPATTTGTVDAAFSQTFTQSGVGTHTPAVFSLNSGSLPTGLTLHSGTGVLDGTPGQSGSFPITVKVTDSNGCTGISPTYTLVISCQTITVTNPATTTGTVDAAFSQTFTQSGVGTHTPAVFSINSGSLPSGLTLSSAGVLSGTPGQPGSFPITVKVTDANGCTGIGSTYTLVIGCQTITVTKPATTTGTVDAAFSQTFTQSGVGTHTPATFTTASTLPAGLSLSTAGVLSGTPTQTGSFPIVVTVTDANGCTGTSSTYTLVINCQTITVTKPATTTGTVDAPFSQTFTQSGAHGTATFTTASTLPAGLSLATNGTLSGTPTVTGNFPIVVTVTDSNGCTGSSSTYTLVIGCQSITVTNPATTTGTVDTPFSQMFTQSGAHGSSTFTLNTGSLPAGLTLASNGTLSGSPTTPGSFPITVKVTDANGCFGVGATYTLVIGCQSITVTNPGVSSGTVDAPFSQTFTQSGAHGSATFSKTGALPSGMSFSTAGVLSGTPGQPGSFPITVTVTDSNGCTGNSNYTLVIACQTITVTNPATTTGTVDAAFSQTFTQSGVGTHTPATFTTASTLPSGLLLSSAGVLSGTPGQPGTFPIVVTVTDANGCTGTGATYNLVIACQTITVTNPGVTLATYNTAFSQTFTGTGLSHTPLNWTLASGSLPAGITLNSSTGVLSGTPTVTGTFAITVKVTDVNGCNGTGSTYTLQVQPKLVADSYTTEGNTQLFITGIAGAPTTPAVSSGTGLLANDSADVAISTSAGTAPTLGVISYDTAGRFIYTPNVGATGSDVFTYSGTANGVTATASITITISNRIWYVNSSGSNGDGRSNTPFNSMTGADTAANAVNDFIFVHTGAATTTGSISLLAGQTLWGQGSTFTLGALTIASGTKPTLTGTVTLGGNNDTVSSLDLSTGSSTGITNSATITGALVENNVTITTGAGTGVSFANVTGTFTFTGLTTTSGGAGASLTGTNTGSTFNFSNVNIGATGSNVGLVATGGGTINVTGAGNIISTATGTALNVSNTTIGASGLTFLSISAGTGASGPTNGIILNTTGNTAGLTVSGTGTTAGSGGTIQKTVQGALFTSTSNLSLKNMNFTNANSGNGTVNNVDTSGFNSAAQAAINMSSVTTASFTNLSVTGGGGSGGAQVGINGNIVSAFTLADSTVSGFGDAAQEGDVKLWNLTGTCSVTNSTFSFVSGDTSGGENLFEVRNSTASALTLTVSGSTFQNTRDSTSGSGGLAVTSTSSGTVNLNVYNNDFLNLKTSGVETFAKQTSTMNLTVTDGGVVGNGNNFDPQNTTNGGRAVGVNTQDTAHTNFNINRNPKIWGSAGPIINIYGQNSSVTNGYILNNPDIRNNSTAGSPVGSPIYIHPQDNATGFVKVSGNTLTTKNDPGILCNVVGDGVSAFSAALDVELASNNITMSGTNTFGVELASGASNSDATNVYAYVHNNAVTGAGASGNLAFGILSSGGASEHVYLQNFTTGGQTTWNNNGNTPINSYAELINITSPAAIPAGHNGGTVIPPSNATAMYRPETNQREYLARDENTTNPAVTTASAQRVAQPVAPRTNNSKTVKTAKAEPSTVSGQRAEDRDQRSAVSRRANHASRTLAANHSATTRALLTPFAPPPPPTTVNQSIGTLPAGKSVTITFQVTLHVPSGTNTISTQGTVTYDSGQAQIANLDGVNPGLGTDATLLTDDPKTAAVVGDATVTPVDTPTAADSTVGGQILDSNGNPVEGAAVRMTGTQNRLTVTDAAGNYHFDNVETNGFYTIVPSRANFSFSPSQRAFSQLGQHTDALFSASSTGAGLNPLDTTEYFVRQQYVDFLNREPDESGFNFWVNNIESCGNDANCRAVKRTDTSAAFFLSIEFQQTGYLVYRTYQAAYGEIPGAPVPIRLGEFKPDAQKIGKDVVVLQSGWEAVLENNKQAFAAEFVQRSRFTAAYPATLTPSEFVNKLFTNAGVNPSDTDRSAAVSEFGSAATSVDVAARGRALRRVAENSALAQQDFNQAFVLMEYFGYLRRDANSGRDTDFSGYNFWLNKLNTFNGNFRDAEMVKAFLVSTEYRGRFPR